MKEFISFSLLIYGFLFLGWTLRRLRPRVESHSKSISRWTMIVLETPAIASVFWGLEPENLVPHLRLSATAVCVFLISGVAGYLAARLYRFERPQAGTFTVTAMLSNVGMTLGGFLCLLYLGDQGLELSQMYMLSGIPYFFTVIFLTARAFSTRQRRGILAALRLNLQDPVSLLPMAAIVLGLALAIGRIPFPAFLELPRRIVIFASVALYSLSFGLTMRIRDMFRRLPRLLGMVPIKFVLAPAAGYLIARAWGYSLAADPVAFKVIIIQSSMPVAIWSVVACKLFDLDDNFAVALWIFTTLLVALLIPFYAWLAAL